jgi:hypothetical protein
VHRHSGIGNLAFQLLAAGGTHPQGKSSVVVPGVGIDTAAQIFYRAVKNYMTASDGFKAARKATAAAAHALPFCSSATSTALKEATHKAWSAVGVFADPQIWWPQPQPDTGGGTGSGPGSGYSSCDLVSVPKGLQLLRDSSFGTTTSVWKGSTGVVNDDPAQPARTGAWKAWLGGRGVTTLHSLSQQTSIPSVATSATLSFYLHIDTAEPAGSGADVLLVELRDCAGVYLTTLELFSSLDQAPGYVLRTFDLTAYKGQAVRVGFKVMENSSLQTSFVLDDVKLTVK